MRLKIVQDLMDIIRLKNMHTVENGYEYINIFGVKFKKKIDLIKYWEERAKKYGERAVRNITRTVEQSKEEVNAKEKLYFSVLENAGISNVNVAIDFGCGVGSYENFLSQLAKKKCMELMLQKNFLNWHMICQKLNISIWKILLKFL